ncbi:MAG: zinc-binding dehydrogenase [Bacteroidetes bacterium]|nr:zinc-binding dehydrogenase [Bacteroidota bacterium]
MSATTYTAWVLQPDGQLKPEQRPLQQPAAGHALIKLKAAALNHRDLWITQGRYANITPGTVLGSDGCGTVVAVGSAEDSSWVNTDVILNPNINWGDSGRHQDQEHYRILGMPDDGTLAQYVNVPVHRLSSSPAHLKPEEAAALPLGGMTAYRALFSRGMLKEGQKVLVTGFGGGVAQFALQFALQAGNAAYATSSSDTKLAQAMQLGAAGTANYTRAGWEKTLQEQTGGGVHLIIDGAGGDSLNTHLSLLRPGGRMVIYGATTGLPHSVDLRRIFWKQLSLLGSTMASDEEFQLMVQFVQQYRVRPVVDTVFDFDQVPAAFARMAGGQQMGKLVVNIS